MSLKNYLYILVGCFLVVGFFVLSSPERAFAGVVGCCINKSGNCAGGCGTEASNCQTMQLGSCKPTVSPASLCDATIGLNNCFVEGGFCSQETNTLGVCSDAPVDAPDCTTADDCEGETSNPLCLEFACTDDFCVEVALASPDPSCIEEPFTAGTVVIPTLNQWGMIAATVLLGFFAILRLRSRKDSEV